MHSAWPIYFLSGTFLFELCLITRTVPHSNIVQVCAQFQRSTVSSLRLTTLAKISLLNSSPGSFSNPANLEHGSSSTVSKMHLPTTSTARGTLPSSNRHKTSDRTSVPTDSEIRNKPNHNPLGLGSSDKNDEGTGNHPNTTTESSAVAAADNTATVTSTPGPTLPPEKLGSGLLLIQSPMNFDEALAHCQKSNMTLAMPQNKREHAILVKAMKRRGIVRMWIGVRKITA